MRIVSWNIQKMKAVPASKFREMLAAVNAQVIVLQEAPASPSATGWTFHHYPAGAQDTYAIGVAPGVKLRWALHEPDPRREFRDGHDANGLARRFLVARITVGDGDGRERLTLATCHAPHYGGHGVESSEETWEYLRELSQALGARTFHRPTADAGGGHSNVPAPLGKRDREAKAPKTRQVDLFLGDTNVYNEAEYNRDIFDTWVRLTAGRTTGHKPGMKHGHALDRIAFRPTSTAIDAERYRFGRIYLSGRGVTPYNGGVHHADQVLAPAANPYSRHDAATDLWMEADHLAIYFDTGTGPVADAGLPAAGGPAPAHAPAPAPPPAGLGLRTRVVPSSAGASKKGKPDGDGKAKQ